MPSKPEHPPQQPDVVERGTYSDTGQGPKTDTTSWDKSTPEGAERQAFAPGMASSNEPRKPGAPALARDKLARSTPPRPPERSAGIPTAARAGIAVVAVVLILGAALALLTMSGGPEVAPEEEVAEPEAPAEETPKEVGGIPVKRGLNRDPLPPKQK